MKKVLFIGNVDEEYTAIQNILEQQYTVFGCVSTFIMITQMIERKQPDMILFYLKGAGDTGRKVFEELVERYVYIPLLCVGSEADKNKYAAELTEQYFFNLQQTVNGTHLLGMVDEAIKNAECIMPSEQRQDRKKILLIDDNTIQLRIMRDMFASTYEVMMANYGEKAIKLIQKCRPDMVIMDYEMPEYDGRETLQMIRDLPDGNNIPVVFLTGVKDEEVKNAVLELNIVGYLLKPVKVDMLRGIIEQYI